MRNNEFFLFREPYSQSYVLNNKKAGFSKRTLVLLLAATLLMSGVFGFAGGYLAGRNTEAEKVPATLSIPAYPVSTEFGKAPFDAVKVAYRCMNTVVEIKTEVVKRSRFIGQYVEEGAGSGVIISGDGYIVTNNHVVDGASKYTVTLRNGRNYTAKLIGKDAKTDLAVLKIDEKDLPVAEFGNSSDLKVGEPVLAIGNPLGELGGTVTDGIISALDREIDIGDERMTLLQTNASVNPGNSGGGLFDSDGKLIGIVNAKNSGTGIEGLGFAIPIDTAKEITEELIKYGYVTGRIDLGMSLTDVSGYDAFISRLGVGGVYIYRVNPGSNAERAGFRAGDRIVSIAGKKVESTKDVKVILNDYSVSDNISIEIERSGRRSMISLKLAEATNKTRSANI